MYHELTNYTTTLLKSYAVIVEIIGHIFKWNSSEKKKKTLVQQLI